MSINSAVGTCLRFRKLNNSELENFSTLFSQFIELPGIGVVSSVRGLSNDGKRGQGFILVEIEKVVVERVWTSMRLSKDVDEYGYCASGYMDFMASHFTTLALEVFKGAGACHAIYFADAAFALSGMETRIGTLASKDPAEIVTEVRDLLVQGRPISRSKTVAMARAKSGLSVPSCNAKPVNRAAI